MPKLNDLYGQTFGRLTVVERVESSKFNHVNWLCVCDCGKTSVVTAGKLKSGHTKSCGCLMKENAKTHGLSKHPIYNVWINIKKRCFNKKDQQFKNYGGRGIFVCDRWKNSFEFFLKDMGERPTKKHEIDRIDNDKGYSPENCRWTTSKVNCQNQRTSKYWWINGIRYESSSEAAKDIGVSCATIRRWCDGITSRGTFYHHKHGCYSELKYNLNPR